MSMRSDGAAVESSWPFRYRRAEAAARLRPVSLLLNRPAARDGANLTPRIIDRIGGTR